MVTTSTGKKSIPISYRQLYASEDTKIIHYIILEALSKMNTKTQRRLPTVVLSIYYPPVSHDKKH
jgi:hypothetical protein